MKQIYKKFNSFIGLRIRKGYDLKAFSDNLKLLLSDKKNLKNLNEEQLKIFDFVKEDLFETKKKIDLLLNSLQML